MNNKNQVFCPECGGESTKLSTQVKMSPGDIQCNEYSCDKCRIRFIPALENFNIMNKWQQKIRVNGNNDGESWKKNNKAIIIKEECVGGCCSTEPLLEEIAILFTQVTGHKPDSTQYAEFVNGVRNSKFLTQFSNKSDVR
jgi:hypothetical protein